MTDPIRWVNANGRTRYQPVLQDGRAAFEHGDTSISWLAPGVRITPFLTSRRAALRIARKHEWREREQAWREATDD